MHARPRMLLAVLLGVALASTGCGLSGIGGVSTPECMDAAAKGTATLRSDDCSYCVAGVGKAHAGRTVEVWVHDRSSGSPMEVEVQFR